MSEEMIERISLLSNDLKNVESAINYYEQKENIRNYNNLKNSNDVIDNYTLNGIRKMTNLAIEALEKELIELRSNSSNMAFTLDIIGVEKEEQIIRTEENIRDLRRYNMKLTERIKKSDNNDNVKLYMNLKDSKEVIDYNNLLKRRKEEYEKLKSIKNKLKSSGLIK